jgi:hypothetical protein
VQSTNPGSRKPSCQKAESSNFLGGNSCELRNLSQKTRKSWSSKKIAPKSRKHELNSSNLKLKSKKSRPYHTKKSDSSIGYGLKVKNKMIRVLLDSGLSGDLLFVKKGFTKHISIAKRAVLQLWGTSNGTFITNKMVTLKTHLWSTLPAIRSAFSQVL